MSFLKNMKLLGYNNMKAFVKPSPNKSNILEFINSCMYEKDWFINIFMSFFINPYDQTRQTKKKF